MKIYFVRVTDRDDSGGVAGPTSNLEEVLAYWPDEQDRGKLFQVFEARGGQDDDEKAIYDWCWEKNQWRPCHAR